MPDLRPMVAREQVLALLSQHFSTPILDLASVEGGQVARTFSFRVADQQYIVRFNLDKMLTSNFPKEAYLVRRLARTSLPVAPLVRVGRLGDLHFAISRKLPGKMLQEHTPQEVQALHRERNKQHECRQNQPLMSCEICIPPSCCAVAHDDEQTRHETHVYKTMLRRIEPTERCYDERDDEELRTMDDATKE